MSDETQVCRECDRELPLETFHENHLAHNNRQKVCPDCCRSTSYIDEDARESTPPMSSDRLIRLHGLTRRQVRIAQQAAARVIAYQTRKRRHGVTWTGESADELVDRMLPGATTRHRYHVLTVAVRLADEMTDETREDAA